MIKVSTDDGILELTAEEYEERFGVSPEAQTPTDVDTVDFAQKLAEGLSTATTIAQIRAVARSILEKTEGESK